MISWKRELVGGIAFILAGLLYIVLVSTSSTFEWYMIAWSLIIVGPAFLIGLLFLMNWRVRKNTSIKK
jgi:hypothetical protein